MLPILALLLVAPALAQVAVLDQSVLLQVVKEVEATAEQLQQLRTQVERMGNPADVVMDAARALRQRLSSTGAGRTLDEIQNAASGNAALAYHGNGLYLPPGETVVTVDGRETPRAVESYRKFDAVTQARTTLEDVMKDTTERRQALRQQIQQTVGQLQTATTMAEVAKISGLITAQNAELSAIDREREAALGRVVVQHIENQSDAARQDLALDEERAAAFGAATGTLGQFLTSNSTPVPIPNPRTVRP
jgi:hypothetical protein